MHISLIFLEEASFRRPSYQVLAWIWAHCKKHSTQLCSIATILTLAERRVCRVDCNPGQFSFSMCQWSAGGLKKRGASLSLQGTKNGIWEGNADLLHPLTDQSSSPSVSLLDKSSINCKWPRCLTKLSRGGTVFCAVQLTFCASFPRVFFPPFAQS